METTKTKTIRTTTNNLKIGDIIQHGNMLDGFSYTEVVELNKYNNRIQVMEKFAHGGIGGYWIGKNAIWYVLEGN